MLLNAPASSRSGLLMGSSSWQCLLGIAAISVPALVLGLRAANWLAPTRLVLSGAAAGLFAAVPARWPTPSIARKCSRLSLRFGIRWECCCPQGWGVGSVRVCFAGSRRRRQLTTRLVTFASSSYIEEQRRARDMSTNDKASAKFDEWQACRALLDRRTQALQQEMGEYLAGRSPMPADLSDEVLQLQKKCLALFQDVVKALNSP
jgi:hypothetical protein